MMFIGGGYFLWIMMSKVKIRSVAVSAGLGFVGGAVGGALGNLTEQGLNVVLGNQQEISGKEITQSAITGAIIEGVGGHKYAFAVIVADPAARVRKVQPLMEKLLVSICQ